MITGQINGKISRNYTNKSSLVQSNQRLINWFFIISGSMMTGVLSGSGPIRYLALGILFSFFVLHGLSIRHNFINKVFDEINRKQVIAAAVTSLMADYLFVKHLNTTKQVEKILLKIYYLIQVPLMYQNIIGKIVVLGIAITSVFAIFVAFCWVFKTFFNYFVNFILSIQKVEKRYIMVFGTMLALAIIVVFSITNVFYGPKSLGIVINHDRIYTSETGIINFDVVYTSDTGQQVETDIFTNVSEKDNDIRQPLFGLFALPFGLLAKLFSEILFFIPHSYPILLNIIQVIVLQVTIILISRMLKLQSISQLLFLIMFNATYSFLLFSLNIEQYIFTLFWLILFVNGHLLGHRNKEYYFIGAVGSMVTTLVIFPLLLKSMSLKDGIMVVFKFAIKFLAILAVFGQLPVVLSSVSSLKMLWQFTGADITFRDKLMQYFNFIATCFVTPNAGVDEVIYQHTSYQLYPVTSTNIVGVIILALSVLGFVLTYKDTFSQICFGWIVFSFVILCIIGWGTKENGLVLYTLYFSWSFISLIYKAIDKLLPNINYIKYSIFSVIIIGLLMLNLPGIYEIIKFGIDYYPTSR